MRTKYLSLFGCSLMLALLSLSAQAQALLSSGGRTSPLIDPRLQVKVTVQEPAMTLEAALAALTQKTQSRTRLTLHANGPLSHAPILCLCHNAALPDLLEAFSWLFGHTWQRVEDGLVMDAVPNAAEADPRLASVRECGQQLLYALDRQPPELRAALTQHLIRIGSLPPEVQKAIQALVSAYQAQVGPKLPADLSQAGAHLEGNAGQEHSTNYTVSITSLQAQPDGRTSEKTLGIFLTLPDEERISVAAPDKPFIAAKDGDKTVTLDLKNATLEEALRALAAQAPLNLVGIGAGPFARHADVALAGVPLHEALDSLMQTYGYRWELGDTGILRLWVERAPYQEAVARLGRTLMQQYDRLSTRVQGSLTTEGLPLERLPIPVQQTLRQLAETPKPAALLSTEELNATSKVSDLTKARVRLRIYATPGVPLIRLWIGSDAMGWRAVRFLDQE